MKPNWSVRGVGGKLGVGKSLYAVDFADRFSSAGGLVTANFKINGLNNFEPWDDPEKMCKRKGALILVDEALKLSALGLLRKEWMVDLIVHASKNSQHVMFMYQGHRPPDLQPFKRLIGCFDHFTYIDESYNWFGKGRIFRVRDFDDPPSRTRHGLDGTITFSGWHFCPARLYGMYGTRATWYGDSVDASDDPETTRTPPEAPKRSEGGAVAAWRFWRKADTLSTNKKPPLEAASFGPDANTLPQADEGR